jgi:hypothetical protein
VGGVTVFCVQPFWKRGDGLVQGDLRQFRSETLARNAGAVASHHASGVVVYQLSGEPEFDTWSEPKIIARYGLTPEAGPESGPGMG